MLAAVLVLFGGCSRRETDVARATREQVLLIGVDADVTDLDPQIVTGVADFNTLLPLFEGLVDLDPRTLAPVAAVAESWSVSADGLVWTFRLRPEIRWTDGTPLTAATFVASWRRLLSPTLAAEYASLLYPVANAAAFHRGQLTDFNQVGLTAPDARTLRLRLSQPAPHLLESLALPPLFPVPVHVIERCGPAASRGNTWTRPATFVSNGPFRLKEWRPGQVVAAEKNPAYRGAAEVRLKGVRIFTIENLDTEERMFRAGQLHVVSALPVTRIETWQRENPAVLQRAPFLGTDFFRLNVTAPGLDDARVRRALSLALDRDLLVQRALRGTKLAARSLVPPGITGYAPAPSGTADPAAARRLFAEAGHPGGKDLPPLTILFNSSDQHRAVCEVVQDLWRRELGLEVRLENQEKKVVHDAQRAGTFQVLRSSWTADYPAAEAFLDVFTATSGNNHTHWVSADYDRLLADAAQINDATARAEVLRRAEDLLLTEAPIIPLYHYVNFYLVHPSVHGWTPNPLDRRPLKQLWLEPGPGTTP